MFQSCVEFFLGCQHKHLSFPVVSQEDRERDGAQAQPHVTCLDCGREFWYDWKRMKQTAERPRNHYASRRPAPEKVA